MRNYPGICTGGMIEMSVVADHKWENYPATKESSVQGRRSQGGL